MFLNNMSASLTVAAANSAKDTGASPPPRAISPSLLIDDPFLTLVSWEKSPVPFSLKQRFNDN